MKPVDEDDINLTKVLKIIGKNITLFVSILILFILLGILKIYTTTPIYSSSITLSIKEDNDNSKILDELISPQKRSEEITLNDKLKLVKLKITSKKFIGTIIDKIDKKNNLFTNEDNNTKENIIISNMEVSSANNVLVLKYRDTIANRAKNIVQEIAESYIYYNLKHRKEEVEHTIIFLNQQINDVQRNLQKKSNKLKEYQQKNSTSIATASSSSLLTQINNKKEKYKKVYLKLKAIRSVIENLKYGSLTTTLLNDGDIDISSINSIISNYRKDDKEIRELEFQKKDISNSTTSDNKLNQFINRLKDKDFEIEKLLETLTQKHPEVISVNKQISNIQDKIYSYINFKLNNLKEDKHVLKSKIINNLEVIKKSLNRKSNLLSKEIMEKKILLKSIPSKKIVNKDLERRFSLNEKVYTFLLQKKIETEIKKASIIPNNKIIENATLSERYIEPNIGKILMISVIVGILFGIIMVIIKELLSKKILDPYDIEKLTKIPIYGILSKKSDSYIFREGLRTIRTNLEFKRLEKNHCMKILISSIIEKEGKTTITAQLGKIIQKSNRKVLLIDLDLRKPRLHKELNITTEDKGITNFISEDYKEIVVPIDTNLDFIPAGTALENGSELLLSNKLDNLIKSLEKRYDYIIFDTAPIGSVTDTTSILKYSDIILLVVRAKLSQKDYIADIQRMKEDRGIESVAIIINDMKIDKKSRYGRLGYGYNYGK